VTHNSDHRGAGDYEVGYGKPPKHTRFRKGQSGNPRGRAKSTHNFKTELRSVLDETLSLSMAGREVKLSARKAMLLALRNKALKGDTRAIGLMVAMLERLLPETLMEEVRGTVARDDLAIFAEAIDRHVAARLSRQESEQKE
jgi:hypothetical protein